MSMIHIAGNKCNSSLTKIDQKSISPNAVDVRLDRVFKMDSDSIFWINEEIKRHRERTELQPDASGWFDLQPGSYEVIMENIIEVGDDEAGFVITRSTLNRNGLHITSGLYDSSYSGQIAGMLHVTTGLARIKKGTRVGQFLLFNAEMLHHYNGDYGFNKDGSIKEMEKNLYK